MAEQQIDDELELSDADILDEQEGGKPEGEGGEPGEDEGEGDEEIVISIGEEAAPASGEEAPEWVRDLRKRNRELEKELAESRKGKAAEVPQLGPRPTIEECDYDQEEFDERLNKWLDDKAKADRAAEEAQASTRKAQEAWQAELGVYADQKTNLGVNDIDQAEEEVLSALSPAQQAILIQGAENKALVVYALGKNPTKLQELARITDPVKFAFAAARLEGQTKMEKRKATTNPEGRVTGSAPLSGASDQKLKRLEEEAERTGDRTELIRYRKQLNRAGK